MEVPIHKFTVSSDFRAEREDIGSLALSIKTNGLLQPIVVAYDSATDTYDVVVGRRRFTAMKDVLKYDKLVEGVHFIIRDNIDPLICQLTENLDRVDFKPYELASIVKAIHDRQVAKYGRAVPGVKTGWSIADTASLIGRDKSFVSRLLAIFEIEEAKSATTMTEAIEILSKKRGKSIITHIQKAKASKLRMSDIDTQLNNYYNEDALVYVKRLPSDSIDLVLTDPPYGIDYDKLTGIDVYRDDSDKLMSLLSELMPHYYRLMREGAYLVVFCAFTHFNQIRLLAEQAGFKTSLVPIILVKPTGAKFADAWLPSSVEIAMYGYKPKSTAVLTRSTNIFNVRTIPPADRVHPLEKPVELYAELITTFTFSVGSNVLDTFAGSAASLRACLKTKRNFFGCEIDEQYYTAGISRILDEVEDECEVDTEEE